MEYIWKTTKGYRLKFTGLFAVIIFSTVTGALFPYAIGKIVDQIFYHQQMQSFLLNFLLYAGLYFLNQCGHGALNYLWAHLEITYVVEIRRRCFAHLLKLKAAVWTHIQSGDVMKRIQEDTECFLEFIHRSLFYVLANFIQLGISIGYMLYTNVSLGLVTIVLTPVLAYTIRYFTGKLKLRHQEIRSEKGLLDAWIQEMMIGISEWKLLNADTKVQADYKAKTDSVIQKEMCTEYLSLTSSTVNEALTLAGQLCIYCICAFCIGRDSMTVGQFVACASYFSTCASYFNALGKKITDVSRNLVGIRRVEEFMTWEEEEEQPGAENRSIEKGMIQFENVSFGYEEAPVLQHTDLQIEPGSKIVFVGKSGQGKSTLLQLLYRFYEPWEGTISVDGRRLTDYTLQSLRSQIAVVWQDNGLFHGSLRKNIIFSDDTSWDDRICEILEGLQLKELAEGFPEGLDTLVGSGGRSLSGGQKQRIAIARCIYHQPKILLLDEATSALDDETERAVNTFIYEQLPSATILSVAHRFSAVLAAEKAVVMEEGSIADAGTHDELLLRNELYRTLYTEYQNTLYQKNQCC